MHQLYWLCLWVGLLHLNSTSAAIWQVGPKQHYTSPRQLAEAHQRSLWQDQPLLQDGDTIEIAAGVYGNQEMLWGSYHKPLNRLTIRGVGGRAHLRGPKAGLQQDKGIFIIAGKHTLIEYLEFSGARNQTRYPLFQHGNGAGIRTEPGIETLTLRHCSVHHNENGLLTPADPHAELLIEFSEFAYNGAGDGYSHNIYVGHYKKFTFRYSYSHHTQAGHNLKSRAESNHILYSRIADEHNGKASYAIDLPNAGQAYLIGNQIQQGPDTDNSEILFGYGLLEQSHQQHLLHRQQQVYLRDNTFINQAGSTHFIHLAGTPQLWMQKNRFLGKGQPVYRIHQTRH